MKVMVNEKLIRALKTNFVSHCLTALQQGCDRMLADGQFVVDWKEDKLTAHLVEKIELTGYLRSMQISVNHQPPIYDAGVVYGDNDPSESPRVDLKFTKWYSKRELDYYAEAKNLSEFNWSKSDGSAVNASKYKARYIETGIENFLSGRYPEGCLLAYVVHGRIDGVIKGLNRLIEFRNLPPRVGAIEKEKLSSSSPNSRRYISSHVDAGKKRYIQHLFMQLC